MDRKCEWGKYNRFILSFGCIWGMVDFNVKFGIYFGLWLCYVVYMVCMLFKIKNIMFFCNEF